MIFERAYAMHCFEICFITIVSYFHKFNCTSLYFASAKPVLSLRLQYLQPILIWLSLFLNCFRDLLIIVMTKRVLLVREMILTKISTQLRWHVIKALNLGSSFFA